MNDQPYDELTTRWEIKSCHPWAANGVPESASIDATKHSVFGVSKVAADLMVQEYGRYFGMPTACFRCGCITGSDHSGAKLHGFLAYLTKCAQENLPYTIIGHKGKQVRDNIHGADLVSAFAAFIKAPRVGEVYNMGGSREVNVSMLEAIARCEDITGKTMDVKFQPDMRSGDHIWWISDIRKFQNHYPDWRLEFDLDAIFEDLFSKYLDHTIETVKGRRSIPKSAFAGSRLQRRSAIHPYLPNPSKYKGRLPALCGPSCQTRLRAASSPSTTFVPGAA